MLLSRFLAGIFSVGVMMAGSAGGVLAQDFPAKAIRILTGPTGATSEVISRMIAQGISGPLGQPVVIVNGNAVPFAETIAKGPQDGYALLVSGSAIWDVSLLQKMNYDTEKDLAPITMLSRAVYVIAVHPSVPVKSIKELIALAKARPGALNYASGGAGASMHLRQALFTSMAGIDMVRIPFKDGAPRVTSVLSGEVHVAFNEASLLMPHVKSGRLRGLAVTTLKPTPLVPELPTAASTGLPGFEAVTMFGIWTGGKTPRPIVNRLNAEIVRVVNNKETKDRFQTMGMEAVSSSPEEFAKLINADIVKMTKVVKEANIKLEN